MAAVLIISIGYFGLAFATPPCVKRFLGGLRVTNPPIRLMCSDVRLSVHISSFRTLTRKRFVQSNSNLTGR